MASHSDHHFQTKQGNNLSSTKLSSLSSTSTLSCPKASQPSTFPGVIPHPPHCKFPLCSLGLPSLSRSPCIPANGGAPSGTAGCSSWMVVPCPWMAPPCPWMAPQPQPYLCHSCVADTFAVCCCTRDLGIWPPGHQSKLSWGGSICCMTCVFTMPSCAPLETHPARTYTHITHHAAKVETCRCQIILVI